MTPSAIKILVTAFAVVLMPATVSAQLAGDDASTVAHELQQNNNAQAIVIADRILTTRPSDCQVLTLEPNKTLAGPDKGGKRATGTSRLTSRAPHSVREWRRNCATHHQINTLRRAQSLPLLWQCRQFRLRL